ncbi:MAG: prepilin-type N-terminal cleavage/methylation domain-containing protein [Geopsychrobacter sp.]|nr:prepilin-type N-terminal cleavage/methylation domain-containing protein [Geopsychrobacter sp.]
MKNITPENTARQAGFTLIEMLVVMAILGIAMTVVYNVFLSSQKTIYTQDEIIDVQQNLRISAELLSREIRMAGLLIPASANPISNASTATLLELQVASATGEYARIATDNLLSTTVTSTDIIPFTIAQAAMASQFALNDRVRIYRPASSSEPASAVYTVAVDPTGTTLSLSGFTTPDLQINASDMIVKVAAGAPNPNTIRYTLVLDQILRTVNGGVSQVVADNITNLQFVYTLTDGTTTNTPTTFNNIRSIQITINGRNLRTDAFNNNTNVRDRRLVTLVKIRNT